MLSAWIRGITGHNNLAYFQSKLNPEIDPTCRLCRQDNETMHHLMTSCEATSKLQLDILQNKIPLPDMSWSVIKINNFLHHPIIHSLLAYDTQYISSCLLYTSPSPRDRQKSRMPSSA